MQKKWLFYSILSLMLLSSVTMMNTISTDEPVSISENSVKTSPFSADWSNFSTYIEGLTVPDVSAVNFTLTKGTVSSVYSMQDILDLIDREENPLTVASIRLDDTLEVIGFNPIHLIEIDGWADAWTIKIGATDGYEYEFEVKDLILRDPSLNKYSDNNATIVAFVVNNSGTFEWLKDYDELSGHFRVYGDDLSGKQKIKDANKFIFGDYWQVNVTLNGTNAGYFNSQNSTNIVGDYTSYDWGYADSEYGWPNDNGDPVKCSGYSLTSIINTFLDNADQNYTVSVIALDGYGANKVFTKYEIENGFTGTMIGDPEEEMDNEGKLAILMDQTDDEAIGYRRGPYQLIAPGLSKGSYIGMIVEIRVTLIPSTETDESNIPGFSTTLVFLSIISTLWIVSRKLNKNKH